MDYLSKYASTYCPATLAGQHVTIISMTPLEFRKTFVARTRQIRELSGWERKEIAEVIGVSLENWIKYETRTPLPHYLIARFCRLVGVDMWFLFTGERVATVHQLKRRKVMLATDLEDAKEKLNEANK